MGHHEIPKRIKALISEVQYKKDQIRMEGRKRILIFVSGAEVHSWLWELNSLCKRDDITLVSTGYIGQADLVVFTGGPDVAPATYGDADIGAYTVVSTMRDMRDAADYAYAVEKGKKLLGIGRGAQYITAKQEGGKLIQDVTGHNGHHNIYDWNGRLHWATSGHHQMMYPFNMKEGSFKIIATAQPALSSRYLTGKNDEMELCDDFSEPEIVYYPKVNALAIQGHPELCFDKGMAQQFFGKLLLAHIENDDLTPKNTDFE